MGRAGDGRGLVLAGLPLIPQLVMALAVPRAPVSFGTPLRLDRLGLLPRLHQVAAGERAGCLQAQGAAPRSTWLSKERV